MDAISIFSDVQICMFSFILQLIWQFGCFFLNVNATHTEMLPRHSKRDFGKWHSKCSHSQKHSCSALRSGNIGLCIARKDFEWSGPFSNLQILQVFFKPNQRFWHADINFHAFIWNI